MKPDMTVIGRDPFARYDIVRRIVKTNNKCDWCGQNGKGRLFNYGKDSDGGWTSWEAKHFCGKECHDSYYA